MRILRSAKILLAVAIALMPVAVAAYSQSTYYSQTYYQGTYYSQTSYYSESSYYTQGSYYGEGSYYSQGYYQASYFSGGTYSFEYEPNGYCVRVTVEKRLTHPRTIIQADGYSVACADIETSARPLQRSVQLAY